MANQPNETIANAIALGLSRQRAGRLIEAQSIYQQIVDDVPDHAEALHLLGVVTHQLGKSALAAEIIERAVRLDAKRADFFSNLGEIYRALRRPSDAEASYRQALKLSPGFAEAHNNLGNVQREVGNSTGAEQSYLRAIAIRPDYARAIMNLGALHWDAGRLIEAEHNFRRALALQPNSEAQYSLGALLLALYREPEAQEHLAEAVRLNPTGSEAQNSLGKAQQALGRLSDAEQSYRRAISLNPNFAEAHSNLGTVLQAQARFSEASWHYRQALTSSPDLAEANINVGTLLLDEGRVEEAVARFRAVIAHNPDDIVAQRNLTYAINYAPDASASDGYSEHRKLALRVRDSAGRASQPMDVQLDPERKLRVGYVSGDLRHHPVGLFLEPVLERHERRRTEVFCYYTYAHRDEVSERLRRQADCWREVSDLSDSGLAQQIRKDKIDVLVDLSGHTLYNRLAAFARRPAPVQASWLGYPNTTGLEEIDYRITDRIASPDGFERFHAEKLMHLPNCQWCYKPPADAPEVSIAPVKLNRFVRFGSYCYLAKINRDVVKVWSEILSLVPNARLRVVARGLTDIREEFIARFASQGIDAARIEVSAAVPFGEYLALHRDVDVMLDTFPFSGGTTTCHALWMGVPVVTVPGDTPPSRGSASVLTAIGLEELVAETRKGYVALAVALARNPERIAHLRQGLRARMSGSPLMDSLLFTRDLEEAYRTMWHSLCASG